MRSQNWNNCHKKSAHCLDHFFIYHVWICLQKKSPLEANRNQGYGLKPLQLWPKWCLFPYEVLRSKCFDTEIKIWLRSYMSGLSRLKLLLLLKLWKLMHAYLLRDNYDLVRYSTKMILNVFFWQERFLLSVMEKSQILSI